MNKKKRSFLVNRLRSVGFAFRGAYFLLKTEASIQVQFAIAIFLIVLGFVFDISNMEWIAQLLAISIVMSIEALNTSIEEVANFIHPETNKKIGLIKDIGAGAVFIAAVFAITIGLIIYIPKIF